jgi:membrane protein YqaA with SNARE-associated domain
MNYLGLFFAGFIAATLLPAFSELGLAGLIVSGEAEPWPAWSVATLGNTLGALVNWLLGAYCLRFQNHKWFPISVDKLSKATKWFEKYGQWSLLFAWLPIVGDPLTFAAGVLRVRFWVFLSLVAIGKGARYGIIVWALT